MTKVYGTGMYDFRRHRVAEYPVGAETAPPHTASVPDRPPEAKPGSNLPSSITLIEIQKDRLTKIASENWSIVADSDSAKGFSPELVKKIYDTELTVQGGRKSVPLQRVMILEVSQYLENYLWPYFYPETATFEHVMSMILMINEKFRENVAAWICFHDRKELFNAFLDRVIKLKEEERSLTTSEKINYLLFMINAFQSLEDEVVSKKVLKLAGLQCWLSLSNGRFQLELCRNKDLMGKWKKIARRVKKATKREESFDPSAAREVKFLRNLIEEFLEVLGSQVFPQKQRDDEDNEFPDAIGSEKIDDASVLYCERFMEFLIDLLSQLPTRRFIKPLVADVAVVAKCHLSALYRHEKGKLFAQLVDLLQFYEGFEIDDHRGGQMTDDEVLQAHYERFQAFQLLAFKKIPKLRELALANIGSINKRADLSKKLSVLPVEELRELVCNKLKLISSNDPWSERVDFLIEVMVSFFEKQQSQREAINALPLYPNEHIMWDESLVPSINYTGEGCLALPKLNLQFLTLHDYLLRNFNLFRLESTYEIREDIQVAVPHLLPYINNEGDTAFRGWSRMAVPIKEFRITRVKQPNIGEVKPAAVTATVTFSISSYKAHIRSEWNSLKEHDVLFLLSIRPSFEPLSAEEAAQATVPQRLGLHCVRGCEIMEVRDEEGTLMNDFTGKIKREDWKPPKGELRTVTVALDTAQYHMDVGDIAEKGAEDIYGTFNVLMRRKPKENNFKAILESIRDLMNETCIVPMWLHDIFLGYGDPSAAQWTNMPNLLETVDFKDTFLDVDHVRQCFSDYQVHFVNSDGTENLNPKPPFRIRLPKNLKGNVYALPGNVKKDEALPDAANGGHSDKEKLVIEAFIPPDPGPYPQDQPKQNSVRFTPTQVGAILSGIQPGLTMVVGPPGTGKTDTAVQILNVLYHNCPSQRTLIITHSNQALNDLFEKIMQRDVPARYLLRLGQGEQELATDLDFSRQGRVNAMLVRRLELLSEVERLARSLQLPEDVGYTCETAGYFWLLHVYSRWEQFLAACAENKDKPTFVKDRFPFREFFSDTPQPVFTGESFDQDMRSAMGCFRHLKTVFQELEECRAFELLKSTVDRSNYLMTKQAKIVAMTCTHAALKRKDFLHLGFKYDNLLMEESAQILEIETFIPMLLQRQEDGHARLKRCILIGDHHQLPPVVKNMAFQKYSHMDQSLFTRFVRLGIPYIELNAQGRARPSLAKLYNWRYRELGDLPFVTENSVFHRANAGFSYEYQLIDVPDYRGKGESAPSPWFYQNEGEAEYIVSMYIYMRLLGYPANKISILTTYNGQKLLIRDVINRRCAPYDFIGLPNKVTTVDKFQGQQNDFILLSLVRTRFVGHLRDVRRLVVAMSRARLPTPTPKVAETIMGKGGALSESVVKKILLSYTYVAIWIFLSFTVIVYNKYILDRKMYNWPYPISLTMIHMSFCSSLAYLLVRVFKVVEPVTMSWDLYLRSVVPIGLLYSVSLWLSNSAYIFLSVSFIQMLKALMPVAVYSIGVMLKKEAFKSDTMANMLSISVGVAIAAYGEARFDTWGVILQLGAVCFEATRLVMIQILLTSKGITLNPITSLYYVAPCCLVFLFIPWVFVEFPVLKETSSYHLDFVIFGTNSSVAFALNLAVFLLVGKTSALTMNVAGVVKDWLLIAFSWSVIKDTVTPINLAGYGVAFLGVAYYNHAKLQALKAKEAQKASQIDEEAGKLLDHKEKNQSQG